MPCHIAKARDIASPLARPNERTQNPAPALKRSTGATALQQVHDCVHDHDITPSPASYNVIDPRVRMGYHGRLDIYQSDSFLSA